MTHPQIIIGMPDWGLNGASVFAAHLARGLRAQGRAATLLLTQSNSEGLDNPPQAFALPQDLCVERLPIRPTDDWAVRWEGLIRYLEERAPCIYLPNHDWRMSVVSKRLSARVGIVAVLHTDLAVDYDHVRRLGNYWNAIVGVTETIRYSAVLSAQHLARRIVTIPYGVPLAGKVAARPTARPLRIIYHGALRVRQKRVLDLVEIAEGLASRGLPFEMTIAGDGQARRALEQKAQRLVERGCVRLLDPRPNGDMLRLLEEQDVFLLTSEFEGLPLALLEAMGRGCVPVVSDLPTLSDVVRDGVNGYRVPVGACDEFVNRLAELSQSPQRRQALAAAAHQTVTSGAYRVEDMVRAYMTLFDSVQADIRSGSFWRKQTRMAAPPSHVGLASILPGDHSRAVDEVNSMPLWPSPPRRPGPAAPARRSRASRNLEDYQVVFGTILGRISGVDAFTGHPARALAARGLPAKALLAGPQAGNGTSPAVDSERLPISAYHTWPERWRATIRYLEAQAPCIYIPNYDWRYSCVSPKLSDHVKVIGIVHSDDPQHYEHVARLGHYWDAIVAVSGAIRRHVAALDPSLSARLHTLPYGVPLPDPLPVRQPHPEGILRIVYCGRVMQHQKRVLDVPAIARVLARRGVPFEITVVGEGEDFERLAEAGQDLGGRLRLTGRLSNDDVCQLLAAGDAFLLTSAFEGLPVSLLEAMAYGCVPVVTDLRSGIPEIIRDGDNGFTVPVADIEQFADRLELLARNPARRRQMGQAAHRTVATGGYRLEDMADRYIRLFREILIQDYVRPTGNIQPKPGLKRRAAWLEWLPTPMRRIFWTTRRLVKGRGQP